MNTWSPHSQPHPEQIWDRRSWPGPGPLQSTPLGGQAGAGSRPPLCLTTSPASNPQILPQEEDYGFDIEEKNKAVVVKSVQRGSLAEVRRLRGAPPTPRTEYRQESGAPLLQLRKPWNGSGSSSLLALLGKLSPGLWELVMEPPPGARLPSQRVPPAPPAGPVGAKCKKTTPGSESADYRKTKVTRLSRAGLFCCSEMDTRSGGGRPRLQPQGLLAGREALATFSRGLCLLPCSDQQGVWLCVVAAGWA